MTIRFYYGSGSPFSWKVWLALEHKQLSYNFNVLSLQQGEQKTPEYLAINPRSADFTLYPMLVLVTNSHNAQLEHGWGQNLRPLCRASTTVYFTKTFPPHWKV